jgi:ParD-like antitoxin of type II bacterial toxin-antitoxin system
MAQSIRISDNLYNEAQTAAGLMEISLAQQIERSASLGQTVEEVRRVDSESLHLKLERQFSRDRERIKSGEMDANALAMISASQVKSSRVSFKKINYSELENDYT